MAQKKVDMYKASKEMSTRVSDFMNKNVWGITLKTRYQQQLKKAEDQLTFWKEANEKAKGSVMDGKYDEEVKNAENAIPVLQEKYEDQRKKEATFEFTDADKTFFKEYSNADSKEDMQKALYNWFSHYELTEDILSGSDLESNILNAIRGERKGSAKTIIQSGATQFTQKRTRNDILTVFYGKLSEYMLSAGTLKATEIPEDVRDIYAPKKNKKNNKNNK